MSSSDAAHIKLIKNLKNNPVMGTAIYTSVETSLGALWGGLNGSIGKYSLSFFNPNFASVAGNFKTFALMSAISTPLFILPNILLDGFISNNQILKDYPNLQEILKSTAALLMQLSGVVAAALTLGLPPFGATVISMMILPFAIEATRIVYSSIKACTENFSGEFDDFHENEQKPGELRAIPN